MDQSSPRRKRKRGRVPTLIPEVLNPVHQLRVMGRLVRRRVGKPGAPPGTLVHEGPKKVEKVRISLVEYGEHLVEKEVARPSDLLPFAPAPTVSWVNVEGLHEVELVRELGEKLSIHPLVLEDIVSTGQRPKVEEHEGYLYIVLPMLSIDADTGVVEDEQLSLILGPSWVLMFQERPGDDFDPVRERIRAAGSRIRGRGADYLAYALLDSVVDHYFVVLEALGTIAERTEIEVLEDPTTQTMHRLHSLKREMLMVRRAVWPTREMLNTLIRTECPLISEPTTVYLRDVYDHAIRIIDTVEVLRDLVSGLIDLYLSSVSNRLNEVVKALTVMAGIFIPLTFIVGVYGMNFDFMPELEVWWAYPVLWVVMLGLAGGMIWSFRRRGWI
jgi:magnesium transporter